MQLARGASRFILHFAQNYFVCKIWPRAIRWWREARRGRGGRVSGSGALARALGVVAVRVGGGNRAKTMEQKKKGAAPRAALRVERAWILEV
jgi:hypothetical protein